MFLWKLFNAEKHANIVSADLLFEQGFDLSPINLSASKVFLGSIILHCNLKPTSKT